MASHGSESKLLSKSIGFSDHNSDYKGSNFADATIGPNYINTWYINPIGPKIHLHNSFLAHKSHIMDLIEIVSRSAVVTCSLDHKIKFWNLMNGTKLGDRKSVV